MARGSARRLKTIEAAEGETIPAVRTPGGFWQIGPGTMIWFNQSGCRIAHTCDLSHEHETKQEAIDCMRLRA